MTVHLCQSCKFYVTVYSFVLTFITWFATVTQISFEEDSQTVRESDGVVELRLVAGNVFERRQVIRLSTNDGTTDGEIE